MKTTKPRLKRQGDVLLMECTVPAEAKKSNVSGDIVIAWGEVTGHRHRIVSGAELWVAENGERYLQILEAAELIHEEHSAVGLEAGSTWRVIQQREYAPEAIRNVRD